MIFVPCHFMSFHVISCHFMSFRHVAVQAECLGCSATFSRLAMPILDAATSSKAPEKTDDADEARDADEGNKALRHVSSDQLVMHSCSSYHSMGTPLHLQSSRGTKPPRRFKELLMCCLFFEFVISWHIQPHTEQHRSHDRETLKERRDQQPERESGFVLGSSNRRCPAGW